MFEKSLTDLIQGLRANKRNETAYIQKSLEEIQSEVQSSDTNVKSTAIDKLNYLHMLGYDMNWANFNVVEVMAASRFSEKRSGYLAATQSFHQETDVLMLTTNLIRKDLASANVMEVSVALDGLAQITTLELSMDLFDDVLAVLGHSRPYIRKKALICLYKLVLKYPEGLHAFVPQLKERLDDPDPSVISAAVTVICELAHSNPRNYLPLAPKLYHLLNTLTNNWILIKIVKLFASLASIEPRLAKKIHGPLSQLVCTTTAMSLLYECIHTAIVADVISVPVPIVDSIGREVEFADLCARKLTLLYESPDQNVRYVGLVALSLMQQKRPDLASIHFEPILKYLDDPDQSIRMRALEAISGIVTRKNLSKTVKRLMSQLILSNTIALQPEHSAGSLFDKSSVNSDASSLDTPLLDSNGTTFASARGAIISPRKANSAASDPADNPEYRLAAIEAIVDMCTRNSYSNLANFEWYVATLVDLVYVASVDVGKLLSAKLLDVTVRVRQVREFSIKMGRSLLSDSQLMSQIAADSSQAPIVTTAAYILGEYCMLLPANADDVGFLLPESLPRFSPDQQSTFIQAAMKTYTNWLKDSSEYWNSDIWESVRSVTSTTLSKLSELIYTEDVNVTAAGSNAGGLESAFALLPLQMNSQLRHFIEILKAVSMATSNLSESAPHICQELHSLFTAFELNPVSAAAQGKVPMPDGLDLDSFIGDAIPDTTLTVIPPSPPPHVVRSHRSGSMGQPRRHNSSRNKNDPFYLGSSAKDGGDRNFDDLPDVDDIPVVALDLSHIGSTKLVDNAKKSKKKKSKKDKSRPETHSKRHRRRKAKSPSPSPPIAPVEIAGDEDMIDDSEDGMVIAGQQQQTVSAAEQLAATTSERSIVDNPGGDNIGKNEGHRSA
ncbi:AP-3 complex subunit delta [Coemansia spiralis]|uniref:AP-3 complex subunit delta n=2 Tax=Coemansia TaxID=4863 RepID=A0A9W8GBK4_9FUNG|nr:AP-3 complex subunit delta [Coemansia umbellata]KAJ2623188.1 AP-3 complex subunit delta [Coemansia sp. RSA 1358]KAJ2680065.1 AP-3 complex subunit delta [Coemansia spiralis]